MKARINYLSIRGFILCGLISIYMLIQHGLEKAMPFIFFAVICFMLFILIPKRSSMKDSNNNSIRKIK